MSIQKRDKPVPQEVVDAGNDLEKLSSALRHPEVDIRAAAAWRLGLIGRFECLAPLINALKDPEPEVRAEAAKALGAIKVLPNINRKLGMFEDTPDDIWAMNELMKALKDKEYSVRAAAGTALVSYGKNVDVTPAAAASRRSASNGPVTRPLGEAAANVPAVPPTIGAVVPPVPPPANKVRRAEKSYPPIKRNKPVPQVVLDAGFDLEALKNVAHHKDPSVREAAIFVLGHMGDEEGVPAIVSGTGDSDTWVRETAAKALGSIHYDYDTREVSTRMEDNREDRNAVSALLRLLKDKEVNVRAAAAASLANYGRPDVSKALLAMAHDPLSNMRAAVALGLGGCPYPDAVNTVIRMLQDEDFWTRLCAVRALSKMKLAGALVPMLSLVNDPNASVRANVARALGELCEAGLGTPSFWQLASDSLLALSNNDTSDEVIGMTQEALKKISSKR